MANQSGPPAILFQIPWASIDSPSAVNIWAKNMMKAFILAGFTGGIHYLGSRKTIRKTDSIGFMVYSSGWISSIILRMPKIRAYAHKYIQANALSHYARHNNLVVSVDGPFSIKDDKRRVNCVQREGAKYLHAILEHPAVMRKEKRTDSGYSRYMSAVSNIYDVVMPITTCLEYEYRKYGRTKPILLNPIVVDRSIGAMYAESARREIRTFAYSGNICHTEEILNLLKSFAIISKHVTNSKLVVIGGEARKRRNKEYRDMYQSECRRLGIDSNTVFAGRMPHTEALSLYRDADAFLLPRPFRLYSQAGFPTKLGEYLLTGRPVVTTATGDIPLYLEDKRSAYLVYDSSPESFAEKIIECIMDKDSSRVGANGQRVAEESFSIEAAAERIRLFFQENEYLLRR